jgi:hypothetical protein
MKSLLITTALTLFAVTSQAPAQLASIPELAALDHYSGSWKTAFSIETGEKKDTLTGNVSAAWVLGGRFMQQNSTIPHVGNETLSLKTLMTYDPLAKTYRLWSFTSMGSHSEGVGTWDEASNTFSWTILDPKTNATTKITSTITGDGKEEWVIVSEDATGKTTGMTSGTNTRTKKKTKDP